MRAILRLACLSSLALTGCAVQRAEILGPSPLGYTDASFIVPHEDEYFWVAPPVSGPHGVPPTALQLPKAGVWVREGWLMVEFQCFTPSDRPAVRYPILPETPDQRPVFVHAGHHYELRCSPTRIGEFVLADQEAQAPSPGT
jgi:hypothetical protein